MSIARAGRAVGRWLRRVRARRRARLASLGRADEHLVEASHRAQQEGASYDTWRATLPVPRRGTGMS